MKGGRGVARHAGVTQVHPTELLEGSTLQYFQGFLHAQQT